MSQKKPNVGEQGLPIFVFLLTAGRPGSFFRDCAGGIAVLDFVAEGGGAETLVLPGICRVY